ncbi:hypothetical protein B0H14DRAFT_2171627, partial [Mycena olivaceomarginata]
QQWPRLSWGLILGCNLVGFVSQTGRQASEKSRLFTTLVSISFNLIWNLRTTRRIERNDDPEQNASNTQIHNRWVAAVNAAL